MRINPDHLKPCHDCGGAGCETCGGSGLIPAEDVPHIACREIPRPFKLGTRVMVTADRGRLPGLIVGVTYSNPVIYDIRTDSGLMLTEAHLVEKADA